MKAKFRAFRSWLGTNRALVTMVVVYLILAAPAYAQAAGASPWENAVNVLMTAFTTTIARGLALVAIVVGGLTFAFGRSRPTLQTRLTSWFNSRGVRGYARSRKHCRFGG